MTTDFRDAQQAAGFVTPALYRTHAAVLLQKYPKFNYYDFLPVNTEGDLWDIGTLVYSGDFAGAADYVSGKGFDIPDASANFTQGVSNFYLAGVGYQLSLQEANRAMRMMGSNQDPLQSSLGERKAQGARLVADKFVYDVAMKGKTEKNITGLVNNPTVPTANAPTGGWATATGAQMLADVNTALNDVIVNSLETSIPDTLALPTSKLTALNNAQLPNAGMSVLAFVQANNSYTALTGQRLKVINSRELETAGAGGTRRMIAYESDPQNLEFFLPGAYEFLDPFAISSMSWRVDGVMNVGQLEIYRPKTLSYRDGI